MQVIVSGRRFEVTNPLRQVVEERVRRLERFEPRLTRAEVTLLDGKNRCEVEARVSVAREGLMHARAEATDFRTAVDRAVDKLGRQLRRLHARRRSHRGVPKEARLPGEEPTS
ncbi:MAG: ribosome hibernation-promoting factor, HPF/YfiA family [Gemmatimonadota bacterium]